MGLSVTAKVDSLIAKFDLFYNTVIDSEVSKCQAAGRCNLKLPAHGPSGKDSGMQKYTRQCIGSYAVQSLEWVCAVNQ